MIKFRTLIILATASLVAGTALARSDCGPRNHQAGTFAVHLEKYRARLHDKLKLSPEQETAWKTFTDKTKLPDVDRAKAKAQWSAQWSELRALPAPARMDRMIDRMKQRESRMQEWAAAVKEFYAQLTPEQQAVFDAPHRRPMRKR